MINGLSTISPSDTFLTCPNHRDDLLVNLFNSAGRCYKVICTKLEINITLLVGKNNTVLDARTCFVDVFSRACKRFGAAKQITNLCRGEKRIFKFNH